MGELTSGVNYTVFEVLYILYTCSLFFPILISLLIKMKKDGYKNVWLFGKNGGSVSLWIYYMAFLVELTHVVRCFDVGNVNHWFGPGLKYYYLLSCLETAFLFSIATSHLLGTYQVIGVMAKTQNSNHNSHNLGRGGNEESQNSNYHDRQLSRKQLIIIHNICQVVCLSFAVVGSVGSASVTKKSGLSFVVTVLSYVIIMIVTMIFLVLKGANEANSRAAAMQKDLNNISGASSIEAVHSRAVKKLEKARNILVFVALFVTVIEFFLIYSLYKLTAEHLKMATNYYPSYGVVEFFCLTILLAILVIYKTDWQNQIRNGFSSFFTSRDSISQSRGSRSTDTHHHHHSNRHHNNSQQQQQQNGVKSFINSGYRDSASQSIILNRLTPSDNTSNYSGGGGGIESALGSLHDDIIVNGNTNTTITVTTNSNSIDTNTVDSSTPTTITSKAIEIEASDDVDAETNGRL